MGTNIPANRGACTESHRTKGQELLDCGGQARDGFDYTSRVEPWAWSRSTTVPRTFQRGDTTLYRELPIVPGDVAEILKESALSASETGLGVATTG